jgi:tetratricopeptide (TPR) repeat protein
LHEFDRAIATFNRRHQIANEIGDKFSLAYDKLGLGVINLRRGEARQAQQNIQEASSLMRELDTPAELAFTLSQASAAHLLLGDIKSARAASEEAISLIETRGVFSSDFQIQAVYWQHYQV